MILLAARPARAVAKCHSWCGALPVLMSAAAVGATASGARCVACSSAGSSFASWSLLALLEATATVAIIRTAAGTTFPIIDCGKNLVGVARCKSGHELVVVVVTVVVVALGLGRHGV